MKLSFLMLGLLPVMAFSALADDPSLPVKISARAAAAHYDQTMTVTGIVVQVSIRPAIVFINLDQPYPDSPFVAIIHSQDTNQFSNVRALKGRSVEITGKVVNYHDHPEIVLAKPSQITVYGGWPATPAPTTIPAPALAPHPDPAAPKPAGGTNNLTTGVM